MGHDAGITAGNTWRTGEPVLLGLSREDWGNTSALGRWMQVLEFSLNHKRMDQNVILNLNTDNYSIQFPLHTRFIQSYTSNAQPPSLETTSNHNLLELNWSTNSTSKTIWCPSLFTIFIYITLQKNNSIELVQFMSSTIKQQDHVWKTMGGSRMRAWTAGQLPLMAINHAKSWPKNHIFSHENKLLNLLHDNLWTSYKNSHYFKVHMNTYKPWSQTFPKHSFKELCSNN